MENIDEMRKIHDTASFLSKYRVFTYRKIGKALKLKKQKCPVFSNVVDKVVAVRLEGKTAVQIREEFGIEADLTEQEVEAIQQEEEWDTLVEAVSG